MTVRVSLAASSAQGFNGYITEGFVRTDYQVFGINHDEPPAVEPNSREVNGKKKYSLTYSGDPKTPFCFSGKIGGVIVCDQRSETLADIVTLSRNPELVQAAEQFINEIVSIYETMPDVNPNKRTLLEIVLNTRDLLDMVESLKPRS